MRERANFTLEEPLLRVWRTPSLCSDMATSLGDRRVQPTPSRNEDNGRRENWTTVRTVGTIRACLGLARRPRRCRRDRFAEWKMKAFLHWSFAIVLVLAWTRMSSAAGSYLEVT